MKSAKGSKPVMGYKEVHEFAKTFTGKDKEMDSRLIGIAKDTWDTIGGDILQSMEEMGEKASMPRSHVIEVVCDADYMFSHGRDPEAYAYYLYLRDKQPSHLNKVMKEAFPYKTYGW